MLQLVRVCTDMLDLWFSATGPFNSDERTAIGTSVLQKRRCHTIRNTIVIHRLVSRTTGCHNVGLSQVQHSHAHQLSDDARAGMKQCHVPPPKSFVSTEIIWTLPAGTSGQ